MVLQPRPPHDSIGGILQLDVSIKEILHHRSCGDPTKRQQDGRPRPISLVGINNLAKAGLKTDEAGRSLLEYLLGSLEPCQYLFYRGSILFDTGNPGQDLVGAAKGTLARGSGIRNREAEKLALRSLPPVFSTRTRILGKCTRLC